MLKIRLARHGRKGLPFFRIVLTEHTKSPQRGYSAILGWFDPIKHVTEVNVDAVKEWMSKWAQPSERVAKLAFAKSGDAFFKDYFTERTREKKTRNPDKFQ